MLLHNNKFYAAAKEILIATSLAINLSIKFIWLLAKEKQNCIRRCQNWGNYVYWIRGVWKWGRGVCGRGGVLENVKGILSVCTFLGISPLDFCAKDLCCAACQQSQPKRPHTHTHTHTHMCIYRYILPLPFTTFWPSLIDCLTRGPANNLQFLLQSQSASCLFLFLSLSPFFSLPPFTYYAFLSLSF